ncbi:MAG: hypothetical protein ACXAC8_19550 [Candidatus Hodarchaeales archaeon]|jgi:hypothetical protein
MRPDMFGYPVEIYKHKNAEWPFDPDFSKQEIIYHLKDFFGYPQDDEFSFEFYNVNRPGFGIDRAVTVFANRQREYYTIRIFSKPSLELTEPPVFNLATYRKERIQHLFDALRDHYPATYFVETENLLITLQRFIFYPVCQFKREVEIIGLLEIMWLASKAQILLDFNTNHWLVSEDGKLYYVDTDFMGQLFPDRYQALYENFNQSMAFITEKNCNLLHHVLPEFATRGNDYNIFLEEFLDVIMNFLKNCKTIEEMSDSIRRKLDCLDNIVDKYWLG